MSNKKNVVYSGVKAVKSSKRTAFINGLVKILTDDRIYKIFPRTLTEEKFVFKVHPILEEGLAKLLKNEYPSTDIAWRRKKAASTLIWEKDPNVTVNHTLFLGTQHRPDMFIVNKDYRVAIEYKLVKDGESIRAAIGQGLVYASDYEFTICVLLDTTKDQKIYSAYKKGVLESILLSKLWNDFGVKVLVTIPLGK